MNWFQQESSYEVRLRPYRKRADRECGELQCEWMRRFDDARHEALEHAALVGDRGKLVARVQAMVDNTQKSRRR